jgi:hypothetical protein
MVIALGKEFVGMSGSRRLASCLLPLVLISAPPSRAENCCDPNGPFAVGEEYPEKPATCETIEYWANRAPNTEARISLGINGRLTMVRFNGVLAYLVMCELPGVQVMCVTYSTNGLEPGETALFAGGYTRIAEKRIVLDPCLASRE